MLKSIPFLFILISLAIGFLSNKQNFFFPFYSWNLFTPLPPIVKHLDFNLAEEEKKNLRSRFPSHFNRYQRKKWLQFTKEYQLALKMGKEVELIKIVERFKRFLQLNGVKKTCPVHVVKYSYNPIELYKNNQLNGEELYQTYPCSR